MEQPSLWQRIPLWTKLKIYTFGAFVAFCGLVVVVGLPGSEREPSALLQKLDDRSATLEDWTQAPIQDQRKWADAYTRAHLGRPDPGRTEDLRKFLDGMAENLGGAKADPRAIEAVRKSGKVWDMAAAGARLMGWPPRKQATAAR